MCTAIISIEPGLPVLLAGIRDELTDRPWQPPGRHWPDYPGLTGGRDLQAGGTWLAVAAAERRVACVLNARGLMAADEYRRSRGALPLRAAAGLDLDRAELGRFDPFHLLSADPGQARLVTWDGQRLTDSELGPGLHIVVNHGLGSDLLAKDASGTAPPGEPEWAARARANELARVRHFAPLFRAAARPEVLSARRPGPAGEAWGEWFPLVNGDGLPVGDPRALIVRRELPDGRIWGSTSVSLAALAAGGIRYDFSGSPGDRASWRLEVSA